MNDYYSYYGPLLVESNLQHTPTNKGFGAGYFSRNKTGGSSKSLPLMKGIL